MADITARDVFIAHVKTGEIELASLIQLNFKISEKLDALNPEMVRDTLNLG